jgi:putative FmdB family regulatory protein
VLLPIYEYLCEDCNRIFSFVVPTMDDERRPRCPKCGREELEKQLSIFAFVRGGKNPLAAIPKQEDGETTAGEDVPVRDEGLYHLT